MKDIMTLAFTFPGQGSQSIGMGKLLSETFASSRAVFEEINDALDQNLSRDIPWGNIRHYVQRGRYH